MSKPLKPAKIKVTGFRPKLHVIPLDDLSIESREKWYDIYKEIIIFGQALVKIVIKEENELSKKP